MTDVSKRRAHKNRLFSQFGGLLGVSIVTLARPLLPLGLAFAAGAMLFVGRRYIEDIPLIVSTLIHSPWLDKIK